MLTKEQLFNMLNNPTPPLTGWEKAGRGRTLSMGLEYYGRLRHSYPYHYNVFARIKKHPANTFANTVEGFIDFVVAIGDISEYMKNPMVLRNDESEPFIAGNMYWHDFDTLKRMPITTNLNHISKVKKKQILEDFIKTSKEDKIYLDEQLMKLVGYTRLATMYRGIRQMDIQVYNDDGKQYYILKQ